MTIVDHGLTAQQLKAAAKLGQTPAQYACVVFDLTTDELAMADSFGLSAQGYAEARTPAAGEVTRADELAAARAAGMTPEEYDAYKDPQPDLARIERRKT